MCVCVCVCIQIVLVLLNGQAVTSSSCASIHQLVLYAAAEEVDNFKGTGGQKKIFDGA